VDELRGAAGISAAISSRDGRILAESILETTNAERVLANLDALCELRLPSGLEEVLFCSLGVGATFGLRLRDGRRVAIKAHPPERSTDFLCAVHEVQKHLYRLGFPSPEPVLGPVPFGNSVATVDELLDTGEFADGHDPAVRNSMARTLNRLIRLADEVPDVEALSQGWNWPARDQLWPSPHNARFDFEATATGAEWIDGIAAGAKDTVDALQAPAVIGHADWSVDQMRFEGGAVKAVYDWDSLRWDKEAVFVGIAASNFATTWRGKEPNPPTPDEARLFVADFEAARREPFPESERRALFSAAVYAVAYMARCEHALNPEQDNVRGSFRESLPAYENEFLST
jgi:hypothetical protein